MKVLPYGSGRFAALFTCRTLCIAYCGIMALIHYLLGQISLTRSALSLHASERTTMIFFVLMALQVYGLASMFLPNGAFFRYMKRCLPSRNPNSHSALSRAFNVIKTFYNQYIGSNGVYGRKGEKYEFRLMLRELIEIPSQSYQALLMSEVVTGSTIPTIYGLVIVLNCVLVPIITLNLRKIDKLNVRNGVLLVDIFVDIALGAVLPVLIMLPPLMEYLGDPGIITNLEWNTNTLSRVRYLVVTSELDLLISAMPLVLSHFLMNTIHQNWSDIDIIIKGKRKTFPEETHCVPGIHKTRHLPSEKQLKNGFEQVVGVLSLTWGVLLFYLIVRAPRLTSCHNDTLLGESCILEIHPLLAEADSCHCLYISVNCQKSLPGKNSLEAYNEINTALESTTTQNALTMQIMLCPIIKMPQAIELYERLNFLNVQYNYDMAEFELKLFHMKSLFQISIEGSALTSVPETLKHQPPNVYYLAIMSSSIQELPEWIKESWQSVRKLFLEGNELTEISPSLIQLTNLQGLSLSSNSIHLVPQEITQLIHMREINLANNSISSLPYEMTKMPLKDVHLQWNLIHSFQDLPWDKQTLLNWDNEKNIFALSGNPICENGENEELSKSILCIEECAPTCDRYIHNNAWCNPPCNTTTCHFDNGICLF